MDNILDIFGQDAFSVVSLTDALRDVKHRPSRLGDMGIFEETSVPTTKIAIERIGDIIQLVKPSPRGSVGEAVDSPKRNVRSLEIPHFERPWSVYADEVQGVREFGTNALRQVQTVVMQRMKQGMDDLDVTDEFSRLGAVQGVITYADGSTLNLFSEFNVVPPASVDFDLDAAAPVDGVLRRECSALIRSMRKAVGGLTFGHVHALVGDAFFDDLMAHKEVRETYRGWSDAKILRESYVGQNRASNPMFEFGGIVWENYGAVDDEGDGALLGIASDEARFFPVGVPGLFRTYHAPADYAETVNTPGERTYARQRPMGNGKGILGEVQRNALHICTRPSALQRGHR